MIISTLQEFYPFLKRGRPIIAIDYGQKKLGIAISNREHNFALPLKTINEIDEEKKIKALQQLVNDHSICAIVIGLPINLKGEITSQTEIVKTFANKLSNILNLPIYLQDERLTSRAADNMLKSIGMKRKERNTKDDLIAASLILESTLGSINKM